jgi:transposase InsO family protein
VAVKCHAVADAQRCAPRVRGEEDGVPIGPLAAPSSAATPADLLRVANVLGTRRAKALADVPREVVSGREVVRAAPEAVGLRYRNHEARNAALPHWLEHYNTRRPHSGIGGQLPISRAHNLSRQDS